MSFTRNHFTEPRSHPFVNMFPRNEEFDEEDEGLFRVNSILHHKKITLFGGKISIIPLLSHLIQMNKDILQRDRLYAVSGLAALWPACPAVPAPHTQPTATFSSPRRRCSPTQACEHHQVRHLHSHPFPRTSPQTELQPVNDPFLRRRTRVPTEAS